MAPTSPLLLEFDLWYAPEHQLVKAQIHQQAEELRLVRTFAQCIGPFKIDSSQYPELYDHGFYLRGTDRHQDLRECALAPKYVGTEEYCNNLLAVLQQLGSVHGSLEPNTFCRIQVRKRS